MDDLLPQLQRLLVLSFLLGSMGSIGLALTPAAVIAPLRNWRFVGRALVLNFLLAPVLAWLLTAIVPLERGHAVGLLLLSGAAGAPFLPKLAEMAGTDLSPAASLVLLLTVCTLVFLPFAVPVMIPGLTADPWAIAQPLLAFIIAPLAGGMLIRSLLGPFAVRVAPNLAKLGNISLLLLCVLLVVRNSKALFGVLGSGAVLATLIFFTVLVVSGWLLGGPQRSVLGLGTAARNFGAALAAAQHCFEDPNVTVMIIVGVMVSLAVTLASARWMRRQHATSPRTTKVPSLQTP